MVGADAVAGVEVEAVRCLPIRTDPGVKVHLAAAQAHGLRGDSIEQLPGVATAPDQGHGGQVVDVDVDAPGRLVASRKPATATASRASASKTPISRYPAGRCTSSTWWVNASTLASCGRK